MKKVFLKLLVMLCFIDFSISISCMQESINNDIEETTSGKYQQKIEQITTLIELLSPLTEDNQNQCNNEQISYILDLINIELAESEPTLNKIFGPSNATNSLVNKLLKLIEILLKETNDEEIIKKAHEIKQKIDTIILDQPTPDNNELDLELKTTDSPNSNTAAYERITKDYNQNKTEPKVYKTINGKNILSEDLTCIECSVKFETWRQCCGHFRSVHPNLDLYSCRLCTNYSTNDQNNLAEHLKIQHNQKDIYPCLFCSKAFPLSNSLSLHLRKHNKAILKCDVANCGFLFQSIKSLNAHKKDHSRELYQCTICKVNFMTIQSLRNHKETHEPLELSRNNQNTQTKANILPQQLQNTCTSNQENLEISSTTADSAPAEFIREQQLARNQITSNNTIFSIPPAQKKLINPIFLNMNQETDKVLPCNLCSKKLKLDQNTPDSNIWLIYQKHINQDHHEIKPFKCEFCSEFEQTSEFEELAKHIENKHKGQRQRTCPFCLKYAADTQAFLTLHIKSKHMVSESEILESNENQNNEESNVNVIPDAHAKADINLETNSLNSENIELETVSEQVDVQFQAENEQPTQIEDNTNNDSLDNLSNLRSSHQEPTQAKKEVSKFSVTKKNNNQFVCPDSKCLFFPFNTQKNLERHINSFHAAKKHKCDFPECNVSTATLWGLKIHKSRDHKQIEQNKTAQNADLDFAYGVKFLELLENSENPDFDTQDFLNDFNATTGLPKEVTLITQNENFDQPKINESTTESYSHQNLSQIGILNTNQNQIDITSEQDVTENVQSKKSAKNKQDDTRSNRKSISSRRKRKLLETQNTETEVEPSELKKKRKKNTSPTVDSSLANKIKNQEIIFDETGKKYYKCIFENCNFSTTRRDNYLAHRRSHTGEKPFKCSKCQSSFTQIGNLRRHEENHDGERKFKCEYPGCTQSYTKKEHLKRHQERHNENCYKCEYPNCSKSFVHKEHLKRHEKTHLKPNQKKRKSSKHSSKKHKNKKAKSTNSKKNKNIERTVIQEQNPIITEIVKVLNNLLNNEQAIEMNAIKAILDYVDQQLNQIKAKHELDKILNKPTAQALSNESKELLTNLLKTIKNNFNQKIDQFTEFSNLIAQIDQLIERIVLFN